MSEKWTGFAAGATLVFNLVALGLLAFPLGLPTEVVRWTAVGVLTLDTVLGMIVFTFYKGGGEK